MIRLARPLLGERERDAVHEVLQTGHLVQGPRVAAFEAGLRPRTGTDEVVACSSGTAALHLALEALELPPGSPVAVPDYTFPATINVVLLSGLRPVLVDIDPGTYNLSAEDAAEVLSGFDGPSAFLPVHQFGLPAPLGPLLPLCAERGIHLVEDAACALGSALELDGAPRPAGSIGVLGCFSFHPRKVITTGEGGAVSTSDRALADRLRLLRNHGMQRSGDGVEFVVPAWNYRLSELHAAVGLVQLERLPALSADRARIAEGYEARLRDLEERGLRRPTVPAGAHPSWQSYVVRLPEDVDRDAALAWLRDDRGIETSIGAHALHVQPAYRDLPGAQRPMPGAEEARARALCLPVPFGLTEDELDRVAAALAEACAHPALRR